MPTPFEKKCLILGQLWSEYKDSPEWEEYVAKNDLGLPLGFLLDMELVREPSELAKTFINQSFTLLLGHLGLPDTEWGSIEDMIHQSERMTS